MTTPITLTIDNRTVTVPKGTYVVDAAKKIGIDIPVFCYHPKMEPVGMCRMCLVEVGRPVIDRDTKAPVLEADGTPKIAFANKLDTGCTIRVEEGMVIRGLTDKVTAARSEVVEFILTSHPLDCPVCDKGGECPLQNLTMQHGPGTTRYLLDDKIHLAKQVPLGELIYLDRERCIQCARCVRFQDEIVDDAVIGFFNRGRKLEIVTHSDPGFDSYWSGNTSDICPVGALTTTDFRFAARPWELNAAASICNECPVGCNVTFNTRREAKSGGDFVIKRAMPRQNEQVNEIWLCDKGRFAGYHFAASPDRLTEPLIRNNGKLEPASWAEALDLIAEKLGVGSRGLLTLAGGRLPNEDLFTLAQLTAHLGGKTALYTHLAGGDLVASHGLSAGSNLGDLGKDDTVIVFASDLEEEAPVWWLRIKQAAERGTNLIVVNPRATKLDRAATRTVRYVYGEEVAKAQELVGTLGNTGNLIIFYGSEGLGLAGSAELAGALAALITGHGKAGTPNNGLVAVHPHANDQGAWDMGFRPEADLKAALSGAGVAYIAAADPAGDDPELVDALDKTGFVIVQELFLTETALLADVVLPAQAYVERDGSFTSGERRVQRFFAAVPAKPGTRADFTITAQIASRLGLELEGRFAPRVFARLAGMTPGYEGLTYSRLAQTAEQFPIVGRGDMYYGGTTYENSQGLGAHLGTAALNGAQKNGGVTPAPAAQGVSGGLVAVPVNRLYDRGTLISKSGTLSPRLDPVHVVMHPDDAANFGGTAMALGREVAVLVDASVPAGFVLVPRSFGMALDGPQSIQIDALEKVAA